MAVDLTEEEIDILKRLLTKEYKRLNDEFLESSSFIGIKVTNKRDIKESRSKLQRLKDIQESQNIVKKILYKLS